MDCKLRLVASDELTKALEAPELKFPILGLTPGAIAGAWVLTLIPPQAQDRPRRGGDHRRLTTATLHPAGVLSGFMGT